MLDIKEIEKIIPQRAPFLMIDKVEEFVPGESAIAYKNVNINEWYFQGHFPGNPIMPGVLITEALAQTGAVAILSMDENKGKNAFLSASEYTATVLIPISLHALIILTAISPRFAINTFFNIFPPKFTLLQKLILLLLRLYHQLLQ